MMTDSEILDWLDNNSVRWYAAAGELYSMYEEFEPAEGESIRECIQQSVEKVPSPPETGR